MRHYISFAFLLICFSINAQNNVIKSVSEVDSIFSPKLTGGFYVQERQYQGDLFFNNKFVKSDILLSTGEMLYGELLKYNGYLDEVIWMNHTNYKQFIIDKAYISDFWTKDSLDHPAHFRRINVRDTTISHRDIFVEVVIEGKLSLYIQHQILCIPDEITYSSDGQARYIKTFEPMPLYYIKLPSDKYLKMHKLGRRSFLNLFPEQKKSIYRLVKKNHLNLKSVKGLIGTIDLMNKESIID
ncbi:MAG: hypothetical protein ABFC90_09915 [Bacteroidales bacterium]|nr:hypothetical protein [Bacteroidales bacterium]